MTVTVLDTQRYRQVLGHFCTGVTVVTTIDDAGGPAGFACQAFAALSLDPPLVLFCPGKQSGTWQAIAQAGHCAVNVLGSHQREISQTFGTRCADKFTGVTWDPAASGAPVLDGVLSWLTCDIEAAHEAGDHYVVIGRVTELGPVRDGQPLLFYRGRYAETSAADGEPPAVVDTLLSWPRYSDWL